MLLFSDKFLVLSVLLNVLVLGGVLFACWLVQRHKRYLLWLVAGYVLSAFGLAWQSVMPAGDLTRWCLVTGVIYLAGAWSLARGMGMRYSVSAHPLAALAIASCTLALLYYYAFIHEDLWARVHLINVGLGLLQVLPVPAMLMRIPAGDRLGRIVCWSYAAFACYTMVRPALLLAVAPLSKTMELTLSGYWLATLAGSLLFALWFTAMLVASVVRDAMAALREERNRDPLTQLLNRRAFFEAAQHCLGDVRQGPWMLLTCDIDHFKQVNDNWGHAVGDEVLCRVARLLAEQAREGGLAARFGGEEFVLLLPHTASEHAQSVARGMCQQLSAMHIDAIGGSITASFGVALPTSPADLPRALTQADALLYRAKQSGRNQVCMP